MTRGWPIVGQRRSARTVGAASTPSCRAAPFTAASSDRRCPPPSPDKPPLFQTDTPAGFIHADAEYLPPSGRQLRYAYVAIDRATRFADPEILRDRRGAAATVFLARPRGRFRLLMHTS